MPLGSFTPLLMDTPWIPAYASSWVEEFRWAPDPETDPGEGAPKWQREGYLEVRFKDGTICQYQASEQIYDDFFDAPSKGRFVHDYLYTRPYVVR